MADLNHEMYCHGFLPRFQNLEGNCEETLSKVVTSYRLTHIIGGSMLNEINQKYSSTTLAPIQYGNMKLYVIWGRYLTYSELMEYKTIDR